MAPLWCKIQEAALLIASLAGTRLRWLAIGTWDDWVPPQFCSVACLRCMLVTLIKCFAIVRQLLC